jgi:murein DD-endopeptidase MepM/ murein hydrolase activator NlpD
MRRAIVLAALLVPAISAAAPAPMIHMQIPLRDVVQHVVTDVVDNMKSWAPPPPDLTVLTTEPVQSTESSGFGWREDPIRKRQKFHHGADYRGKPGTPILAAGAGTVIFAGRRGGYGNAVFIDHGNGVVTRYAHMRRIETKVGETVAAGTRIGQLGSTGRTTGPHLHFEVRLEGRSVDPNTALIVGELMRESPAAGTLAALALAPEVQAKARDLQDPKNRRALRGTSEPRPERTNAPKRQRALW